MRLHDRRFFTLTNPAASAFVMEFGIDQNGAVTATRAAQRALDGLNVREELRRLWELTRHGRDMNRIDRPNLEED
ncbi:MAG: hypothetical protein LUE17_16235 [Planctomycetaceae bacterium]|nr:hypothetical protein [Planctomycetaceae bacterium]